MLGKVRSTLTKYFDDFDLLSPSFLSTKRWKPSSLLERCFRIVPRKVLPSSPSPLLSSFFSSALPCGTWGRSSSLTIFSLFSSSFFSFTPLRLLSGEKERVVKTYVHGPSGLKVVFCAIEGPLCSASVVVLTESPNDKGLPHTLEHLVFCGSNLFPDRGYLDTLATRWYLAPFFWFFWFFWILFGSLFVPHCFVLLGKTSLTDGTNAWTSDDHTAYTVETVGSRGMESKARSVVSG